MAAVGRRGAGAGGVGACSGVGDSHARWSWAMGVTEELATWAVKTRAEELPPDVVHEAKRDIINVMGVALYAARDPSVSILLDMFEAEGGKPRASVWGTSFRTSLANAALA